MEEQKHYVIVDNETYELYDGNGGFYVSKANHPADFPIQNSFCALKDTSENKFLENIIMPVPISDNNVNSTAGQQHLEPIMIDDYVGNMNYFTQDDSDVTIYLNSSNESNFMQSNINNSGYFVDSNGVIDLTKSGSNSKQNNTDIPETEASLDLNKAIRNISGEELDAPEFIDISKLKLNYVSGKGTNAGKPIPFFNISHENVSYHSLIDDQKSTDEEDDEDDEVIFVKEFQAGDKENCETPEKERLSGNESRRRNAPEPRRNPKRRVQMLKESLDLAIKLSDDDIYWGHSRKSYKEYYMENTRRSSRNTGAVLSPPIALSNEDYKEWPAEGLHERPVFNMATKKIEKFDFKPAEDKRKVVPKKNSGVTVKAGGKKPGKKGKRRGPNKVGKSKKEPSEECITKEFASLTHETLQEVIKYVSQVKEYNEIRKGRDFQVDPHTETGSVIDDANLILDLVRSDDMEQNLNDAVDILTDSCILYSLANDVCQRSVAKYLKSVEKK